MKIPGAILILSGILLFGFTYIATAFYTNSLDVWDKSLGKFFTAFNEIHGQKLLILSISFILVGLFHLYYKKN
ncbi:putative membrane protein [Bacillus cereus]|nr:putative membrane protein [Bacillus cereus]